MMIINNKNENKITEVSASSVFPSLATALRGHKYIFQQDVDEFSDMRRREDIPI